MCGFIFSWIDWISLLWCILVGAIAGNFWRATRIVQAAFVMQGVLLSRTEQELAACRYVRNDWQKVANDRAKEIIRLMALIEDKEAI